MGTPDFGFSSAFGRVMALVGAYAKSFNIFIFPLMNSEDRTALSNPNPLTAQRHALPTRNYLEIEGR